MTVHTSPSSKKLPGTYYLGPCLVPNICLSGDDRDDDDVIRDIAIAVGTHQHLLPRQSPVQDTRMGHAASEASGSRMGGRQRRRQHHLGEDDDRGVIYLYADQLDRGK